MALKENSVEINKIILGETYNSKMDNLKKKANDFNKEQSISEPFSDPGIPTRLEVKKRADAMINLSWTYKESNRVNPRPSTVKMPTYLVNINNFPSYQVGIPYCWGGFDGIDRSSYYSWSNFKDAISKNIFAGNIDVLSSPYYTPGTAGLDCSGFVSASLEFTTKYNTRDLYEDMGNFVSIPLRMDYYVDPGVHVLFFDSWAGSGMTTLNSKESTTDGSPQAAKNYTRTKNWLSTNEYYLKSPWPSN